MDSLWSKQEKAIIQKQLSYSLAGDKQTVHGKLQTILNETQADEFIVTAQIYDHQARLRSYEFLAELISD
jgi:alkanesulfonate monooxygenase SsuD/methylene tetrahydromethanopterin reductase-like flavin-dependent oxidoreductase (luciferase family)